MVDGVQILAVPVPQLSVWRPEMVLTVTALAGLVPSLRPRIPVRLVVLAGLALATGLAAAAIPPLAVAPLGAHFVVDGVGALVRLMVVAMALVVHLVLRPRDERAGGLLALAALGAVLLSQSVTLAALLVAVAVTVLGGGLTAWFALADDDRRAAAQWLATAGLGFAVLAFGGAFWCGLAGTLDLTEAPAALASRPSLPPVAVPVLLCLSAVGLALALLGEPLRFRTTVAREGDAPGAAPVLVAWFTAAPALALAVFLQRMAQATVPATLLAATPPLIAAMAGLVTVGGFAAAAVQTSLTRRLAWAATGQVGLALLGYAAAPVDPLVPIPVAGLLAMAPAHLGAVLLADALATGRTGPRWRDPQLVVLSILLVSLAALPPLAGWRPRLDLLGALQAGDLTFALVLAVVGTLLGVLVYLRPLADLWRLAAATDRGDDVAVGWPPLLPTLLATLMLALVVSAGLGLLDPAALLP